MTKRDTLIAMPALAPKLPTNARKVPPRWATPPVGDEEVWRRVAEWRAAEPDATAGQTDKDLFFEFCLDGFIAEGWLKSWVPGDPAPPSDAEG